MNALKDFDLNDIERNSIENHMFPMTPVPPAYIEGYLVTLSDKLSATAERSRSTGSTSHICPRWRHTSNTALQGDYRR